MSKLPTELNLTGADSSFRCPDEVIEIINDYLADEYGLCVESYNYEIKLSDIVWDTSEEEAYEQDRAWDKMRHGRE